MSLKRMMTELRAGLQTRGLSLHPTKCQVQTNVEGWERRSEIQLENGFSITFLAEEDHLTVLGTKLALHDVSQHELRNRIAVAWRLFWSLKALLTNRSSSVKQRFKLFDSTVGSCVLWCAQSWTLRVEEQRLLKITRRAMLRRIAGFPRKPQKRLLGVAAPRNARSRRASCIYLSERLGGGLQFVEVVMGWPCFPTTS